MPANANANANPASQQLVKNRPEQERLLSGTGCTDVAVTHRGQMSV